MLRRVCGIAGSTDDPKGRVVREMCSRLRHRGPDDEGIYSDSTCGVTIGARRLAVMDIQGGHQPLSNEDGSVWVAFNGEIYNQRELREALQARGHRFATSSDTEVLVHLYEEYGEALVDALEGMFAFALWDTGRRQLMLARDRFGEKPLFLYQRDGELLFASELTPLLHVAPHLRELDREAIDAFFVLAYVPGPGTIVSGIRQLPPGSLLSWDLDTRRAREQRWFSPPNHDDDTGEPFAVVAAEARRLFAQSVRTRMVADVPVGVFLSGGVDSTLVASAAAQQSSQRLKTFTVGYDVGEVNETLRARRVAERLDAEHHEVTLTLQDVAERAPRVLAEIDQPLADRALIPLHALCEFARPRVTVALGGEGSDELFGGYPRYRWLQRATALESSLPARAVQPLAGAMRTAVRVLPGLKRAERLAPAPLLPRNLDWVSGGRRQAREALYGPRMQDVDRERILALVAARAGPSEGRSTCRWLMHLDQVDYLPDDVLVKTDRASMLCSLELRSVFLHRELTELACTVGSAVHLSGGGKALVHDMLPAEFRPRRGVVGYRKTAFRVPAAEWLRGPLAHTLDQQLQQGVIFEEGYFDRDAARSLALEHGSGKADHSDQLWPLLSLGLWTDRFCGLDGG
jgi:asparagine synthase (glutamine-hydrolysing)